MVQIEKGTVPQNENSGGKFFLKKIRFAFSSELLFTEY
jgi:hypothetical protein